MNNFIKFNINAFSFCDIDKRIKFDIYFETSKASCIFSDENNLNTTNNKNLIASCIINETNNNNLIISQK
jgi:hypothetical protein